MLVVLGYKPDAAVRWVRENYCPEAIESKSQEYYIEWMAKTPEVKAEPEQKVITITDAN
jgi:hypothetical protein